LGAAADRQQILIDERNLEIGGAGMVRAALLFGAVQSRRD
jgi:hypothetical protein